MSSPQKTGGKRSRLHNPLLSFRGKGTATIVYVAGIPDFSFTKVYAYITQRQGDNVARYCVSLLHAVDQRGQPGHLWTGSAEDVRQTVEALMVEQYGVVLQPGHEVVRLLCGTQSNAHTVTTVLARLTLGFNSAVELGLRINQPMVNIMVPYAQIVRHRRMLRSTALTAPGTRRTPIAYYRIVGARVVPQLILGNDRLPDDLRAAAQGAHWPLRDQAILEVLIASGARVTEVVEATFASTSRTGLKAGLRLCNKGQGQAPSKTAELTPEALDVLMRYLATERPAHDPLHQNFLAWARGRSWTLPRYLAFLRAQSLDPSQVPLYLTAQGKAYTSDTFRRRAWTEARRADGGKDESAEGRIVASLHHIRHWRINRDLDQIAAEHGDSEYRYVMALQAYVKRMGWASWDSLAHYDHRGVAVAMLRRFARQRVTAEVRHGDVAGMEAAGQQAGLWSSPEGGQ